MTYIVAVNKKPMIKARSLKSAAVIAERLKLEHPKKKIEVFRELKDSSLELMWEVNL